MLEAGVWPTSTQCAHILANIHSKIQLFLNFTHTRMKRFDLGRNDKIILRKPVDEVS